MVFILPAYQTSCLPVGKPLRSLFIGCVVHRIDQVEASKGGDCWCRGVENGDKSQCIASRFSRIRDFGHSEKPNQYMGQAGSPKHQSCSNGKYIHGRFAALSIGAKTQVSEHGVKFLQYREPRAIGHLRAKAQLGYRVACNHYGDKNSGHHIGKNQYAVLGDLGIGNTLHAAENGIHKHHGHTNNYAGRYIHLKEAGKYNAYAAHLTSYVGKGDKN